MFPVKKPHPSKAVFKKHGIQTWQVAQRLNLGTNYMSRILNGEFNNRLRPEIDEELKRLARQLEGTKFEEDEGEKKKTKEA